MAAPQKITFGDMRESGVHGVLIFTASQLLSHRLSRAHF